ncbi:MAG: hypothetical protein JF620_07835 [Mesorhizobium sp.]|nr:hypothetical protein [Mesorhizobium sp.]
MNDDRDNRVSQQENVEQVRQLADRAGISNGLALALIEKYGDDAETLDREAAKLKRERETDDG